MRVYDTPTHWHEEPDYSPELEEHYFELYGENWKEIVKEKEEEYEFYTFPDEDIKHINLEGINL